MDDIGSHPALQPLRIIVTFFHPKFGARNGSIPHIIRADTDKPPAANIVVEGNQISF